MPTPDRYDRLAKVCSTAVGGALAALYVWWRLRETHALAEYSWMAVFLVGYSIAYLTFTVIGVRRERAAARAEQAGGPR